MPERAAPPKRDVVLLLVVLVVVGLVAMVVDLMLLHLALTRGDNDAWILFTIVTVGVLAAGALGARVWKQSSE